MSQKYAIEIFSQLIRRRDIAFTLSLSPPLPAITPDDITFAIFATRHRY
jgi:hypothetical protein